MKYLKYRRKIVSKRFTARDLPLDFGITPIPIVYVHSGCKTRDNQSVESAGVAFAKDLFDWGFKSYQQYSSYSTTRIHKHYGVYQPA